MSKNVQINKFNWSLLVKEAVEQRKKLGLTQKEHAALAGVSIPTMISFEKMETTLSIQKMLDIINVVGMQSKDIEGDSLKYFLNKCELRWQELIKDLPSNAESRHNFGYYTYTYCIEGNEKTRNFPLMEFLRRIEDITRTENGFSTLWIPREKKSKPYIKDSGIECWSNIADNGKAEDSFFWRVEQDASYNNSLYVHVHRGYIEDSMDNIEKGKFIDISASILWSVYIVLNAAKLSKLVLENTNSSVKLIVGYNGLNGRILNYMGPGLGKEKVCKKDLLTINFDFKVSDVKVDNLVDLVYGVLDPLCVCFDFYKIEKSIIKEEIGKTLIKEEIEKLLINPL